MSTGKANLKGLYLLWNMVDGREKTNLYDVYEKVAGRAGLNVMKTYLPDSKRFRKESEEDGERYVFRSTIMPLTRLLSKAATSNSLRTKC